jgi:AraC-like DNA-binding protein
MVSFSDKFLIGVLTRRKAAYRNEEVSKIAYHLITNSNLSGIPLYAAKANMSVRNFERRFLEQVGVSPKSFCRLVRFNSALNFKINNPKTSWTKVAYEFGYYDSMHLIKDFKQFTDSNPTNLLTEIPGLIDNRCYKVQPLLNC